MLKSTHVVLNPIQVVFPTYFVADYVVLNQIQVAFADYSDADRVFMYNESLL